MAACVFCRIIARELPASIVFEDDRTLAFLDAKPLFPGHVLLVPKQHIETLTELPEDLIGPLFLRARRIAASVESVLEAEGTFVAINNRVSQSVPHLHVHVVPRRRKDGLKGFFWPRRGYASDEQRAEIESRLRTALEEIEFPVQSTPVG